MDVSLIASENVYTEKLRFPVASNSARHPAVLLLQKIVTCSCQLSVTIISSTRQVGVRALDNDWFAAIDY